MPAHYYQHHIDIRKDKLCPFKLVFVTNYSFCTCNWHENIEIIFVCRGNGAVRYGGHEFLCSGGDFVIINSGALHSLHGDEGFDYYYLIIDESFCAENGISAENRIFTPVFRCEQTKRLFDRLVLKYSEYTKSLGNTPLNAAKLRSSVLSLLIDLCENHSETDNHSESTDTPSEKHVKKVMYYLEYRYNEQISLEALAAICGITKHHLAREFKRCTGQTVLTYLNTLRCKNAEVCLSEGMSVTDTALECGFESLSYFSRTYKKIMGTSPSSCKTH